MRLHSLTQNKHCFSTITLTILITLTALTHSGPPKLQMNVVMPFFSGAQVPDEIQVIHALKDNNTMFFASKTSANSHVFS